jgi:hypothetical protein
VRRGRVLVGRGCVLYRTRYMALGAPRTSRPPSRSQRQLPLDARSTPSGTPVFCATWARGLRGTPSFPVSSSRATLRFRSLRPVSMMLPGGQSGRPSSRAPSTSPSTTVPPRGRPNHGADGSGKLPDPHGSLRRRRTHSSVWRRCGNRLERAVESRRAGNQLHLEER